jgi:hypothetical protein
MRFPLLDESLVVWVITGEERGTRKASWTRMAMSATWKSRMTGPKMEMSGRFDSKRKSEIGVQRPCGTTHIPSVHQLEL